MTDEQNNNIQQQGQFLAQISHEIRTPLNAISGMSQLLADTEMTETQSEFVGTILRAGTHLLSLVDNLLNVAKLQSNEVVLATDTVNICDEIKASVAEMQGYAKEKGLSISFQSTPEVGELKILDRRRIRQCLTNLLCNAIKFTDQGKIKISSWVGFSEDGSDAVFISVTDTGIGISKDHAKQIFELFHQADDGIKRAFDGAGLGLPVTQGLARLMGGNVEVVSTPGIGSTFSISFGYQIPEEKTEEHEQRSGTILVVEDNQTNQRLIRLVLEKLGHSCQVASNGAEGVEMFNTNFYDLILMDLHMPVMDGFEATTLIRTSGAVNSTLPIIALTADVRPGIEEKVLAAGMDDYLAKPFEVPILATTITTALATTISDVQSVELTG